MGVEVNTKEQGDQITYPSVGDHLVMHYTGYLKSNNDVFDSSVEKGRPFKFQIGIGQVIKGWDEGVMKMSLGEKATLDITPDFGYGERGAGGVIPPNADLIFDVELLAINGIFKTFTDGLNRCSGCNKAESTPKEFNRCGSCKKVFYCGRDCQVSHWGQHKQYCKKWSA